MNSMKVARNFFTLLLCIVNSSGNAICQCTNFGEKVVDQLNSISIKIADYKDAYNPDNDRYTEESYSRKHGMQIDKLDRKIAATGTLRCGGSIATAELVATDGVKSPSMVIVTATHVVYNEGSCTRFGSPMSCVFHRKSGFTEDTAGDPVEKVILDHDDKCPTRDGDRILVLKLRYAPDVVPYRIVPPETDDLKFNQRVVFVAAQSLDFMKYDPNGEKALPKHVGDCNIKEAYPDYSTYFFSACGCGFTCSGGAVLKDIADQQPLLLGIASATDEKYDPAKIIAMMRSGTSESRPYSSSSWRTGNLRITEEVYSSVKKAELEQATSP